MVSQIGKGLYSFVVIATVGVIGVYFIIGFPATMLVPLFVPTVIGVIILGSLLSLIVYLIIGLLAFWIEDI